MGTEERERLALELFLRLAPQEGALAHEIGGGHWVELLRSAYPMEKHERKPFQEAVKNLMDRCLFASEVALGHMRAASKATRRGRR